MSDAGYGKPGEQTIRTGVKRVVDKRFVSSGVQSDIPPGSFLPENNAWRTGPVRPRPRVAEMSEEVITLKGENNLDSARDIFNNRKAYRDNAYAGLFMKGVRDNLIDTWEDKNMYGKVNFDGVTVFPNEYYLRQFRSTRPTETVFGLNFVVKAFEEMRDFIAKRKFQLVNNNFNLKGSELDRLVPQCVRSWNSPRRGYETYFAEMYSIFYNTALQRRKNQIFTVEDFMGLFYEFVDIVTPDLPLTFSGWYSTPAAGLDYTGLIVDVFDASPDVDLVKQKYFIDSQHFKLFSSAAKSYGFFIDKNIPWRLVANLNSQRMKSYMARHGILKTEGVRSDLFTNMYVEADRYDIEFLKVSVARMWENFTAEEPFATTTFLCGDISETSNVKSVRQKLVERKGTNLFDKSNRLNKSTSYFKNFNDLHWIRLYYYIRAKEQNKKINISSLDRVVESAYNEYKKNGIILAMRKINSELA